MGRDISICFAFKDQLTSGLLKSKKSLEEMKKKVEDTAGKIDELNKRKGTIHVDATKARRELKDAEKALDGTKEAADRLAEAKYNFENIQTELRSVSKEAKQAEKDLADLNDAMQRNQNRASSGSSGGDSILSKLAAAGATQMVGQLATQALQQSVESAFGSEASTMLSGILGGATSGAAIGSAVAPGIGTAIGGAVGGLVGAATGALNIQAGREDALKSAVQEVYGSAWEAVTAPLSGGTQTAADREQQELAFGTLLGNSDAAKTWLDTLVKKAAVTPFGFGDLTQMSKTLLSYGVGTDEQNLWMQAIGDAGSARGITGEGLTAIATYLGRMSSTDKVTLEYLNPLMERGINAIDYLAENLSEEEGKVVTTADVYDRISKNELSGYEAARVIVEMMEKYNEGAMELQAQTYSGMVSTTEDNQAQVDAAMGEGYTAKRKEGLLAQTQWLDKGGTKDAYKLIGEYQASLENAKEEAVRKALDHAAETEEYRKALAENDGAEMGRILAEAQAEAEKEYRNSKGYQDMLQSQKDSVDSIREDLIENGTWRTFGYDMGIEFSKGFGSALREDTATGNVNEFLWGLFGNEGETRFAGEILWDKLTGKDPGKNHADGLTYVPYNGYPARLHEGERVLTASEARGYGKGTNVSVTVNGLTVREEADVEWIAETLAQKISEARELAV